MERGENINNIGMTVHLERTKGGAVINQKRFVDNLITPATGDLMYVPEGSKLLDDQCKFMSLNATLMYASKRTYPEISFALVHLSSSRYNRATEDDYAKAMRVAEYITGCGEKHGLILSPKSLQLLAKSDASYAEHADGRSHT